MKYKFMFVNESAVEHPEMYGYAYAVENKNEWVENNNVHEYLTAGYVRGVDYVVNNDIAYYVRKTYLDITGNLIIFVCERCVNPIDIIPVPEVVEEVVE